MGVSWAEAKDFCQICCTPPRLPLNASCSPSGERVGTQACVPGEVAGAPVPMSLPDRASKGAIQIWVIRDSPLKANFLPSALIETPESLPAPVVKRSTLVACRVLEFTFIFQRFCAPPRVLSK